MIGEINGVNVLTGTRITNGYHKLPKPVCVMLFQGARDRLEQDEMLSKIQQSPEMFRELTESAIDTHQNYEDASEEIAT
jgi:hypothetical protein